MDQLLFIYGTLQDPEIQKTIIGRIIEGAKDKISGYKKGVLISDKTAYPVIIQENGSIVEGRVIIINEYELKKIDIYETNAYQREMVTLISGKRAWIYREAGRQGDGLNELTP